MKNSITETKNTLEGINRGLGEAEELVSGLEARVMESNQAEHQKEKRIKNEIID